MDEPRVELADAIEAIRDQLVDAAARGAGSELAFEVGDIQLEFSVELSHDRTVKGGAKAWVLTGGYESQHGATRTQRVSVTLTPKRRADGARPEVGDETTPDLTGL
jgi:Trypsin-co-occurring domain 2